METDTTVVVVGDEDPRTTVSVTVAVGCGACVTVRSTVTVVGFAPAGSQSMQSAGWLTDGGGLSPYTGTTEYVGLVGTRGCRSSRSGTNGSADADVARAASRARENVVCIVVDA